MTFGQFLSILWARKWLAALVFLLVVATTVAVSLWLPKQYVGVASVMIDPRPDPVSVMTGGNPMASPMFLATQVDVIGSDRVALRVIADLKLLDNAALRRDWQTETQGKGSIEQWLVEIMRKRLDVKPSRESNVISIGYTAADARFAAAMANAFAKAYIATTLELRADPARSFKALFDEQAREARQVLERAQTKYTAFQQQQGITASDERFDVENTRLNELSSQWTQLQALSADSGSRQSQALGGQGDRLQEVLTNPLIANLKVDLSRNEGRLQELSARLGDNHPQVVEARANSAELRNRIEAETRRVTGGVGVTNTITRSREAQVQRELATQRAKVLQLKAVRDQGALLQRDVESAQRIFESLTLRQNQTLLETQNSQSFAHQLTVAQPPVQHTSPKIFLNTAMAATLGLMLAMGVALVLELMDRRVRSADDAVAALGLPVLGTLPAPNARRYAAGNRMLPALHPNPMQLPAPARPQHEA